MLDPITSANLLSLAVFLAGIYLYKHLRGPVFLLVGLAFGRFCVTHALTLADLKDVLAAPIIVFRVVAYFAALAELIVHAAKQIKK